MIAGNGVLYLLVCAAGPAPGVGRLVELAQSAGWTVQVVATPSALAFIDTAALEQQTGRPVRSRYRSPAEPRPPRPDAVILAPATYNTINKFALGIADTYVLGLLAEAPGLGIPVVVLPYVNAALASRVPFRRAVEQLRFEGVRMLPALGPEAAPTPEAAPAPAAASGRGAAPRDVAPGGEVVPSGEVAPDAEAVPGGEVAPGAGVVPGGEVAPDAGVAPSTGAVPSAEAVPGVTVLPGDEANFPWHLALDELRDYYA
jgi:hypothetical protein